MRGKSIGVVKKASGEASSLEWANSVTLDGVSAVQLPFGPMDVQAYKSDGVNLFVSLNSGDVLTIENFFVTFPEDEESSELVLQDEEGVLWRGQFDPVTSGFDFSEIVTLEAGVGSDVASATLLDLPDWAVLGLAVLAVGGGAVAVHNGSSSSSNKKNTPNTLQAPDAPTDIEITGTSITGKTQPGFTVLVTDAEGNPLGEAVKADENGDFQYDISSAVGESFFITVTNLAGVSSEPTEFTHTPTGFSMYSFSADEGFDFSAVEDTEKFEMFADEPAELELSLEDVLQFESDGELSFFAEEGNVEFAQTSFAEVASDSVLDVTPLVDPLNDAFEQNHSVI